MKTKVHFFRDYHVSTVDLTRLYHADANGTHGADPRKCRACVNVAVAVVYDETQPEFVSVGVAYRNPKDQFNRKIARNIAVGRAMKNFNTPKWVNRASLDEMIQKSYNEPTSTTCDYQKDRWVEWLERQ
jgi:hypothetical protein